MIANPSALPTQSGPAVGPDVILGWLVTGRTRAEILAENPLLTDSDIDAVLVNPATTKRIPDITIDGHRLTLEEISVFRLPQDFQQRMKAMIGREKRGRPLPGEKEILDDYSALIPVMTITICMAVLELRAKGA